MSSGLSSLVFMMALLAAPAALAGPTCQDRNGKTIRCGTEGAMPVGWALPAAKRQSRAGPEPITPATMLGLVAVIGGVFTLIALMPDFQGQRGGWDEQQGDGDEEAG